MLSLLYVLLLVAAGSNASPCKPRAVNPGNAATPASAKKAAEHVAGGQHNLNALGGTSNTTATAPASSTSSGSSLSLPTSAGLAPAGGSCPEGFINTVFNTGAGKSSGWPSTTWSSLTSNGVNDWMGFSLDTLDKADTYGNCPTTPELNNHQMHVVMDPRDTDRAVEMVQGASPPKYLELFNEPDFSWGGFTPLTDAATAAQDLQKLFSIPHPQTTYISPALMDANSDWLPTFKQNCNGCFDQIPIIALHVYNPAVDGVMYQITKLHDTWPDKKIWITELSPADPDCSMDANGIATYMNELFPKIMALGYVEKIFWNSGEWDAPAINNAPDQCNPALTDASGNATPVLKALKNACGGGGGGGTATS